MAHCYLCTKKLSNENLEHIIPNALGGHLKSRLILCSKCNVKLSDIDGKLCSDLALLTNFIAPKRDNNNNSIPTIKTISNEDTFLRNSDSSYRKVNDVVKFDKGTFSFRFCHTLNSEAQKYDFKIFEQAIKQFAKKNNKDKKWIEEHTAKALEKASIQQINNDIHHFQFEANKSKYSFLGVLKIILGFCAFKKIDKQYLEKPTKILKNKDIEGCNKISNYFNDNSFLLKDSVYHTLYLNGDRNNKLLFAIVSLYGVFNVFCLLSTNYEGDNFNETYCYDLFANKFNPYKISYSLGLKDIDDILNIQIDTSIYTENFNTFMKFFTAKNKTNYLMKIIEQIKIQTFNILVSKYAKLIEIDYKNKFSELFYEEFRKQVDVDFITDDNVNHFIEIILKHIYTYNYYLYNKEVLLLIGNSASLLFSQNLKNKDEILKSLQSYIDNYKSSIAGVNEIFLVNKKDILAFLVSHYRNLLQNPEILDFFIKQDN